MEQINQGLLPPSIVFLYSVVIAWNAISNDLTSGLSFSIFSLVVIIYTAEEWPKALGIGFRGPIESGGEMESLTKADKKDVEDPNPNPTSGTAVKLTGMCL